VLSLVKRNASIVDIYWGPGHALIALIAALLSPDGALPRRILIASLAILWGARLGVYLFLRNAGQPEDFRYRSLRKRVGSKFPLVSLGLVFGLQGVLMWIISLPLQVAQHSPVPPDLGLLDAVGALIWAVGFVVESVADLELRRFKADPANRDRVLDRGLWRYTRHPNYFGDFLVWWGFFAIAAATPYGVWTLPAPLIMSFLLMRVSGVPLLERSLVQHRPGYRDYIERTSAFFPRPPRRPG
jgi:steroid 5-alpha reductase family enzyme